MHFQAYESQGQHGQPGRPQARPNYPFVHDLPDDILLHVFRWDRFNCRLNKFRRITHVCRRWRDLAIETGNLWSNIMITNTHSLAMAQFALERSKQALLELTIRPMGDLDDRTKLEGVVLRQILAPNTPRIKWLSLDWSFCTKMPLISFFVELAISPEAKNLRFFKISDTARVMEVQMSNQPQAITVDSQHSSSTFDLANQTLIVRNASSKPPESPTVHFRWNTFSNLKKLAIYDTPLLSPKIKHTHLYNILQKSPAIQVLEVQGTTVFKSESYESTKADVHTPLFLPWLRKLRVVYLDTSVSVWMLSIIHASALESLMLELGPDWWETSSELQARMKAVRQGLASILNSISPKHQGELELSLILNHAFISQQEPLSFLSSMKTIGSLYFNLANEPAETYQRIFDDLLALPTHIKKLRMAWGRFTLQSFKAFIMAMQSRSGHQFQSVVLEHCWIEVYNNDLETVRESFMRTDQIIPSLVGWLRERVALVELRRCGAQRFPDPITDSE